MTFYEKIFTLDRLDKLINRKGTGSPKSLAKRLEVSERTVYNLIDLLKGLGAEINYCRQRGSYCYLNGFRFMLEGVQHTEKMQGGNNFWIFFETAQMVRWEGVSL